MSQDLITIKQAAEILSIHPLTVYRMVRAGKIQGFAITGKRAIEVPRKAIEELKGPRPITFPRHKRDC